MDVRDVWIKSGTKILVIYAYMEFLDGSSLRQIQMIRPRKILTRANRSGA